MSTLNTSEDRINEIRRIVESFIHPDSVNLNSNLQVEIEIIEKNERNNIIYDFMTIDPDLISGYDYTGSIFSRSSFEKCDFKGNSGNILNISTSNMSMTKLDNSTIEFTNFSYCYFMLASVVNCSIKDTSFIKANFKNVDLRFTKFVYCDFQDMINLATCDCRGTDFTGTFNFPYADKTEFIIALNNYGGKADQDTLWTDGTPLIG